MGQVFTDKVDVTKLKEGMRALATAENSRRDGYLVKNIVSGGWELHDVHGRIIYYICTKTGEFHWAMKSLELLYGQDNEDPAEKMQAEHAEMLEALTECMDHLRCDADSHFACGTCGPCIASAAAWKAIAKATERKDA